ncbi:SDR family NAD(P)-dependent oxidoreductase [Candidatus Peregrinibacteria bacterium]|jgi:3-hydroxy acid dehydrogenase/malonic semialdehyde reductase|nr:SDR family NAD(P)-dependent oxidoreductase [Candidatus Peregrinibacteria bacterium]MBT5468264.1 SDR family NAD(P)-dependent oxidoreductase [Candidatus Peregrinibacteria bacterium]
MSTGYVFITGASSGIGESCARKCAEQGMNLVLTARREEKLNALKEELEAQYSVEVIVKAMDVTDHKQVEAVFADLEDKEITSLINNAGLAQEKASFEDYKWEDFQKMIDTNITGFLKVAHQAVPFIIKNKGHIVNISSIAGVEAYEGGSVYSASKAFVKMVSKSLRIDLAGTGVRVTDIAPGAVETAFSDVRFKGDVEKAKATYQGYEPLTPEDIANSVLFCLQSPARMNVEYMLVMPTAQASAMRVVKK